MREFMKYDDPYKEAMRYVDNAKEQLIHAGKDGKFYVDDKYVRSACGIAYSGLLRGLDFLFDIRKVQKQRGRKSIEYYRSILGNMDNKLLKHLNNGYEILHRYGYYDGGDKIGNIEEGFDDALSIIATLKPYSKNGLK